jgi:Na+/H+-dicarboxylate symporter/ABC-type amino acid transport substrate-binding protein
MSFTKRILVGLLLGIATGLFLGDWVRPLTVVADGFVKLLQMTVLPYVTISIVSSLGGLSGADARRLGLRGSAILLVLWAIGLTYAFLIPLAFPEMQTASFFSTTLVMRPAPLDVVDLYIPSNPFYSLANNIVPAVVLFSVIVGIAMIGLPRKQVLLDVLAVAGAAIARATNFVVQLTPYGIFAIAASAAGTLDFEQVARLQIYLITYTAVAMLMAFWVLPGLVAALTPIPYRDVLAPSRDALITAFMAGDLFIVLPILIKGCKELLAKHGLTDAATEALPDVLVPTAFNFPHAGKLLSLSFVLFAGWLAGAPVAVHDYPSLAISGLLSFFGSLNAAVPFLLDLFRIPADTFFLFVATSVINSRFGTLIAAVHTIAIALVGTAAVLNAVTIEPRRIFRYLAITAALTIATLAGLRIVFSTTLKTEFKGGELIMQLQPLLPHPPTVIRATAPPAPTPATHISAAAYARTRGTLVVAVLPGRMPYAFRNGAGELTGFDIEMAHQLAEELGLSVEFIEMPFEEVPTLLAEHRVDIAMSGILITPRRAEIMRFSQPYLDETLSFMVKDHLRGEFGTWTSIKGLGAFRVGCVNLPYFLSEVKQRAPNLNLVIVPQDVDPVVAMPSLDAFVMPAERGSVMTLLHPAFSIVVPEPDPVKLPMAYGLPPNDTDWAALVNNWIELKRRDGTIDQLYRHWILGQTSEHQTRRWSVIRNVLHWAE